MPAEFLSVCIPTFNRAPILRELLERFAVQMREAQLTERDVAFHFSDNASSDETPRVIADFKDLGFKVNYTRNSENIGIHRNVMRVYSLARGEYCWGLGDDEILCEGALARLLELLRRDAPGLVIAFDSKYVLGLETPQTFVDYRAFAIACLARNPHAMAEHTLISSNIIRSDHFDFALAQEHVHMFFPNMFGLIRPLVRDGLSVCLPGFPIITVRDATPGAGPSDGQWADLDKCWIHYFRWLRDELDLPSIDPSAPSRHARRVMLQRIGANPLRYIWNHRGALLQPSAYRFVLSRLFRA